MDHAGSPGVAPRKISRAFRETPRLYFEEAAEVGQRVLSEGTYAERCYLLGGLACRVRYADRGVYEATHRALRHLEVRAPDAIDLEIGAWDQSRTGHRLPEPHPLMWEDYRDHCLRLCSDARYLALDEQWLGAKSYIDMQAGRAWYSVGDAATLPYYAIAAAMRTPINWLLAGRGRHVVHAAAVGTAEAGVLLAGPAGAGKSSTALSCLGTRLKYLGDDSCGIWDGEAPRIFSLYNSAKLRPENLDRFADLRDKLHDRDRLDDAKATIFLAEHWPDRLIVECPIKAVLLPEVACADRTSIEPAPRKAAWHALLSWTAPLIPCFGAASAALITRFSVRLPAFRLALGRDRDEVGRAIERFLVDP